MPVLQDILLSSFVRDVISRVRLPTRFLSRYLGWGWDGAAIEGRRSFDSISGRVYTYDIYDRVRAVANGRLPNAPSGTVAANPVGNNTVALARFAEKLPLDYNQLIQIRTLGRGASDRDKQGVTYIQNQVRSLRERADNVWEFLAASIFYGGKYFFYLNGDDLVPTLNSANTFFGVNLKIDAGNLSLPPNAQPGTPGQFVNCPGLFMGGAANLIPVAWSDTNNSQIISNVLAISSAFQDIVGAPVEAIFLGSDVWTNVLSNNQVRAYAGQANEPFVTPGGFEYWGQEKGPDGTPTAVMRGRLRGLPMIDWLIYDGSLSLATTNATTFANVKLLPRNCVTFMIGERDAWLKGIQGSEIVKDNDWTEPVERMGLYTWAMEKADPARVWYHTLQNVGVELNTPKAIATAQVQ